MGIMSDSFSLPGDESTLFPAQVSDTLDVCPSENSVHCNQPIRHRSHFPIFDFLTFIV